MNSRNLLIAFLFLIAVAVFFALGIYVGSTQFAPSAALPITEAVPTVQSRPSTEPLSPTDVRGNVPTALPATLVPETSQNQLTETSSSSEDSALTLENLLNSETGILLLIVSGVLVLLVLGFVLYFTVFRPWQRRRLLNKALDEIAKDNDDSLAQAEQLLLKALESGLAKKDIMEAKFALAYARSRLTKYADAALDLANLRATAQTSKETLYLELWLYIQLEEYAKVEDIYTNFKQELVDFRDGKYLFSLAYHGRAREFWNSREIDEAIRCFDILRELGEAEFIKQIPEKTDDKYIVFGTIALYSQKLKEAREYFEQARGRSVSKNQIQLGLLLCDALENPEKELLDELKNLIKAINAAPLEAQDSLILRNLQLWLLTLRLKTWLKLPERKGLPDENRAEAQSDIDIIKKLDEEFSDAYLIEGLLNYLFSKNLDERLEAVKTLKLSTEKKSGVNYADVKVLIDDETKAQESYKDQFGEFVKIVSDYTKNPQIPRALREDLYNYLERYAPYKKALDFKELPESSSVPTIEDIKNRGDLVYMRVQMLLRQSNSKLPDESKKGILENVENLQKIIKAIGAERESLEKTELSLLKTTGEFLLKEETYDN